MTNLNRDELAIEIEKILNQTEPSERSKWCMYKVPDKIRKLNKDAYTPKVLSIGPFHYGNQRLQNMQTYKWEYFKRFVERTRTNLDDLVKFIEKLEPSVRRCYANNIVFNKKQLVKIILLDACFIIELFWRCYYGEWSRDDPLLAGTILSDYILWDTLLLENQLPFFLLEELFNRAFLSFESDNLPSFLELTLDYFNYFNKQGLEPDVVICHFTDLLRHFYLKRPLGLRRIAEKQGLNFSATKLHEAGVKFEVNDTSRCLLELQFSGGVLKIPKIAMLDDTEIHFRNMVAFEQCHCLHESYIYDYAGILDFLIDTEKDVDVLVKNGIILNHIGDSNAVATMINGLGKNVVWPNINSDYNQLCKELNDFCTNPCRKLAATLKRDYCSNPWKTVASIAGMIILCLTLLQTIFSGIQVTQQSKNA